MEHTRTPLRRRFVGAAASVAIALAAMTTAALPARADNNDLARALAAIAAIALIAKVIDNNRDRGDDDDGYVRPRPPPVYEPRPRPHPVPVPEPVRRVLPSVCAIELTDRGRREVWYSRPCLRQEGVRVDLPRRCTAEVRLRGREVMVYRQDCLFDAGFRPERNRWDDDRYKHEDPHRW